METRIQRHRKYRAELIKEGSNSSIKEKPMMNTTTALPIKDVIDTTLEEEASRAFYKKKHTEKIIQFVLLVLLVVSLIVGIIVFGIYAFRG